MYSTLFRGETPVHYYPPAQKLPPKALPGHPYPGTALSSFPPQYAPSLVTNNVPSQALKAYSTHQYQPSVKSSSISSIYPDIYQGYKGEVSHQYPYNSAYQQNNYFHASPPYQPHYDIHPHESVPNYQQYYIGVNDYSST